jgi:hypothetical protein
MTVGAPYGGPLARILVEDVRLKIFDLILSSNCDERCQIDVHEEKFWWLGFDLADRNSDHCAAYL